MKFFVFVALIMMIAVQAFALPALPGTEPEQEIAEPKTGAAKTKRAILYYSSYPTLSYYPYLSPVYNYPTVIV
ncbi:hypothetical protein PGB90_009514 [Kerria lacca]